MWPLSCSIPLLFRFITFLPPLLWLPPVLFPRLSFFLLFDYSPFPLLRYEAGRERGKKTEKAGEEMHLLPVRCTSVMSVVPRFALLPFVFVLQGCRDN